MNGLLTALRQCKIKGKERYYLKVGGLVDRCVEDTREEELRHK